MPSMPRFLHMKCIWVHGGLYSEPISWKGKPHSLKLNLPPLGAVILKPVEEKESVIP